MLDPVNIPKFIYDKYSETSSPERDKTKILNLKISQDCDTFKV